jgi:subtilase family serine protease
MKHLFRTKSRGYPVDHISGWRRLRIGLFGGLASASLLLISEPLSAAITSVELSPLIYRSTLISPVDSNKQIGVVLALPSSDPAGLTTLVEQISTPGNSLFRQYLTPQEFAQRFGGNQADYLALKNWATANGLSVSQETDSRTNLTVRGSVAQFQRLFKTQLNTYRASDGQSFYSASVKPTVPAEIAAKLSGVIGLTAGKPMAQQAKIATVLGEDPATKSNKMRGDTAGGTGPGGTYSCTDLRSVYGFPEWGELEKGMIVDVFEQGYYRPTDVKKYFERFGIGKNTKQTAISVDQSPIAIEPVIESEACLDLDMLVGMNPHIAEVKVFIDDFQYDPFPVAMVDALQAMADDGTAQIVSISYGQDEGYYGSDAENAENTALQQLAAEGIAVFASSGDDGAFGDGYNYPYNVAEPGSNPYVTCVGGTSLYTGPHEAYYSESVWNEFPNDGATGGGISTFWSLPAYQTNPFILFTLNGGSATMRNVPDVGAIADPLTGVGIYVKDEGGWTQIGGTSLACPVWAGYVSNINAALHWSGLANLGPFNPPLYGTFSNGNAYAAGSWFNDIQGGSNGYLPYGGPGYSAALEYDFGNYNNCTGLGSMYGFSLAIQILLTSAQPGTPPGTITIANPKVTSSTARATWSASNGTSGYVVALYANNGSTYDLVQAQLLPPTVRAFEFKNLLPDYPYGIEVYGYNASGGTDTQIGFYTLKK